MMFFMRCTMSGRWPVPGEPGYEAIDARAQAREQATSQGPVYGAELLGSRTLLSVARNAPAPRTCWETRDNLAFAVELDRDWRPWPVADQCDCPGGRISFRCNPCRRGPERCGGGLRRRYEGVITACATRGAAPTVVRASSLVENLNSRLRSYFFLRRQLGKDYLTLLQCVPEPPPVPAR